MAAKRAGLTAIRATKGEAPPALVLQEGGGKPIGQTLRLSPDAWHQLRQLATDERAKAHALLIEAVNDLFRKRNLPPIA